MTTALSYDRCLKALFSRQFESLTRLHRKFQRNAAKRIEESSSSDRFMESVVYTGLQQCRVRRVLKNSSLWCELPSLKWKLFSS